MMLIINTAPKDYFEIILARKKTDYKSLKVKGSFNQAEKVLPTIDKLLTKQEIKKENLRGIGVVVGPGGFTSVRIGVAVANGLGYGLSLPIAGIKADEFSDNRQLVEKVFDYLKNNTKKNLVEPLYDREPNITPAKKSN